MQTFDRFQLQHHPSIYDKIEPGESATPPTQINVVLNWLQEVRQRVAGK